MSPTQKGLSEEVDLEEIVLEQVDSKENKSLQLQPVIWDFCKIHISKSAALQVVFEYFEPLERLQMQQLNKKFYNYTVRSILARFSVNRYERDMTLRMRSNDKVLMVFGDQSVYHWLDSKTRYEW